MNRLIQLLINVKRTSTREKIQLNVKVNIINPPHSFSQLTRISYFEPGKIG